MAQETRTNLDNLRAMEDTLDSGLRDMLDTSNSFTNNMETVEEEIKRMRESLVELDFKSEKAVVVETLTAQVDRMTEDKARQEENTAAELERLAGKIAELNDAASARLTDVDIYSQAGFKYLWNNLRPNFFRRFYKGNFGKLLITGGGNGKFSIKKRQSNGYNCKRYLTPVGRE